MSNVHNSVTKLWNDYLISIGEDPAYAQRNYAVCKFGMNDKSCDELAELVYNGQKTATTSLYCLYTIENDPLPKEGDINIVTASNDFAICIIETTKVAILPFSHVDAAFAYKEGEGDKSLESWRDVHSHFFSQELKAVDKQFSRGMLVVCEEFKVLYRYE